MVNRKKRWNNRIFGKMFLSYLLLLVIPISVIGVITTSYLFESLAEDTRQLNMDRLNRSAEILDMNMRDINAVAYRVARDYNTLTLMRKKFDRYEDMIYCASKVVDSLGLYLAGNNFFDTVGIYFSKNNVILTKGTIYTPEEYYNNFFKQDEIPYEEWLSAISSPVSQNFIMALNTERADGTKEIVTYFQPVSDIERSSGTIITTICTEEIFRIFHNEQHRTEFMAVDRNSNAIMRSSGFDIIPSAEQLHEKSGSFPVGSKQIIYSSSGVISLKYIYLVPQSGIIGNVKNVRNVFLILLVVCLLFGLCFAYFNVRKNYLPIELIFERISRSEGEKQQDRQGMNAVIRFIDSMSSRNEELEDRLEQQIELFKKSFLMRLLQEPDIDSAALEEMKQNYGLKFVYPEFNVILAVTMDMSGFAEDTSANQELADFAADNVMAEMLSESYALYKVMPFDGKRAYIINYPSGSPEPQEELERIRSVLIRKCGIRSGIGLGGKVSGIEQLHKSYDGAAYALNKILKSGESQVLYCDEAAENINEQRIYYSRDKELVLTGNVKSGTVEGVCAVLDEIYRNNFETRSLPEELLRCVNYSLMMNLLNLLDQVYLKDEELRRECVKMCREAGEYHQSEEAFALLKKCYLCLTEAIAEYKQNSSSDLYSEIVEFISENYADKELSLDTLVEKFRMSYHYLSAFFKKESGYNFPDYLNRLRLEHARELLKNTDESVTAIGEAVGYLSGNTFIRTYKKYFGMTPGQYRKECKSVPPKKADKQ